MELDTLKSFTALPHDRHDTRTTDRRSFVKASLIPAAFPLAAMLSNHAAESAEPGAVPAGLDIVDTNVHLFPWPCRFGEQIRTKAGLAAVALATVCVVGLTVSTFATEQDEATLRRPRTDSSTPPADAGQAPAAAHDGDYEFDGTISRKVLENYLDFSVTMAYSLVTGKSEGNREYPYHDDDVRLIQNIGAKFIGLAV